MKRILISALALTILMGCSKDDTTITDDDTTSTDQTTTTTSSTGDETDSSNTDTSVVGLPEYYIIEHIDFLGDGIASIRDTFELTKTRAINPHSSIDSKYENKQLSVGSTSNVFASLNIPSPLGGLLDSIVGDTIEVYRHDSILDYRFLHYGKVTLGHDRIEYHSVGDSTMTKSYALITNVEVLPTEDGYNTSRLIEGTLVSEFAEEGDSIVVGTVTVTYKIKGSMRY